MQKCKFTVYFDPPFWVCVCERRAGGALEVCKITFGAEPKDGEVYEFLLQNWSGLRFSPPVQAGPEQEARKNPKRMQREIRKQMEQTGVGTKAQQALKLQQAQGKEARKKKSRAQRQQEKLRQFAIRQQKKKQKHRGH